MWDYELDLNVLEAITFEESNKGLQPNITMTTKGDGGYKLELDITPQQMIDALTAQGYIVWTPEDLKDEDKD